MIFLHIGRDKTGTTRLQEFLKLNQDALKKQGYTYPLLHDEEIAHHRYASAILNLHSKRGRLSKYPKSLFTTYGLSRLHRHEQHNPIISSELFGNIPPTIVKKYLNNRETIVFLYLREQSSYLVSAYCQRVLGTNYSKSIEEFAHFFMRSINYNDYIKSWQNKFNKNGVKLRIYQRDILVNKDIRDDFLNMLDPKIDSTQFKKHENALIETFGGDLLKAKILLNKGGYANSPKKLMETITALRKAAKNDRSLYIKPAISPDLTELIRAHYRKQNECLFDSFYFENGNKFNYSNSHTSPEQHYLDTNFNPTHLTNKEKVLEAIHKENPNTANNLKKIISNL